MQFAFVCNPSGSKSTWNTTNRLRGALDLLLKYVNRPERIYLRIRLSRGQNDAIFIWSLYEPTWYDKALIELKFQERPKPPPSPPLDAGIAYVIKRICLMANQRLNKCDLIDLAVEEVDITCHPVLPPYVNMQSDQCWKKRIQPGWCGQVIVTDALSMI